MKKIILLIVIGIIGGVIYAKRDTVWANTYNFLYQSPCDKPITYRIGTDDPRFNLSSSELKADVQQAANVWNDAYGKTIFAYDPNAAMPVSLIYDGRQTLNNQISQLDGQLKQHGAALKPEMADYEKKVADYKAALAQLNNEIESWNAKGGAPEDVYNQLKSRQENLRQEADNLNAMAKSLSLSTDQYNADVQQLDQTVNTYNQALLYKPEEGIYKSDQTGKQIVIYFYNNKQEFVHTVEHELGHAIGIEHINNPNAIMFPQTNLVTTPSTGDMAQLEAICQKKSIFATGEEQLISLYRIVKQQIDAKLNQ